MPVLMLQFLQSLVQLRISRFVTWFLFPKVTATSEEVGEISFATHENCGVHKIAVEVIVTLPETTRDVGEILSTAHTNEKVANRDYVFKLFENCQFLA